MLLTNCKCRATALHSASLLTNPNCLQTMFSVATGFTMFIVCFYTAYRAYSSRVIDDNNMFTKNSFIWAQLVWSIYSLISILYVIHVASAATRVGNSTGVLIHKIMIGCEHPSTLNRVSLKALTFYNCSDIFFIFDRQLMQFSQQIQHRSPLATCGLFVFDWTLCYAVS